MATIFWLRKEKKFIDYDKRRSREAKKPRIQEFVLAAGFLLFRPWLLGFSLPSRLQASQRQEAYRPDHPDSS
jgi:hypothetical protein